MLPRLRSATGPALARRYTLPETVMVWSGSARTPRPLGTPSDASCTTAVPVLKPAVAVVMPTANAVVPAPCRIPTTGPPLTSALPVVAPNEALSPSWNPAGARLVLVIDSACEAASPTWRLANATVVAAKPGCATR